mmetsp:Transcript_18955/g.35173  ORF Transcript_18955/g.35173 Transcript_18955/m.35173 type:complete len:362 (+) Transcript_18955:70-1155(+)
MHTFPLLSLLLLLLLPSPLHSCTCSPFSGNPSSCCPSSTDICSHWGGSKTCKGDTPVCCNSDFDSVCCPENSGCTQGCRDSMLGECTCVPFRNTTTYNEQSALNSLVYVAASQCSPSSGLNDTWSCTACPPSYPLTGVNVVSNDGHAVLTGYDGENIIVAFRGSLSLRDWISDAENAVLTTYPNCDDCEVGLGWYSAMNSVRDLVIEAVEGLSEEYEGAGIILTGHSLGAAMAPLWLVELEERKPELSKQVIYPIYTFGQPRVGNEKYAEWFMERTGANNWYRVVHHDDPVPHLPPPALKFVHMSTEVWYVESGTGDGNFMVCNGSGEDQQCSGGTLVNGEFNDHTEYLDHDIHQCNPSGF